MLNLKFLAAQSDAGRTRAFETLGQTYGYLENVSPYCKLAFLSTTRIFVFRNHLADPKICISPVPTAERQGLEYQTASEVLNHTMKGFGLVYIPHKMSKQQTLPVTARQAGYCRARSSYHSST